MIADNDAQATNKDGELLWHEDGRPTYSGFDHAHDVAAKLKPYVRSLKVLDLGRVWPDCPIKGDVSNFLGRGNTLADLEALVAAPAWEPSQALCRQGDPPPAPDPPRPRPAPKPKTLTEQSVMRIFVEKNKDRLRFNHDSRQWLVWSGHYWKPDGKRLALCWALELCRSLSSKAAQKIRFATAVETAAQAQQEVATINSEWDRDPLLFGTPGGVVDLRTGKLRPGRPEDMISKIALCAPADEEDCPKWKAFLDYALEGNADNIAFLQRAAGYSLTGSVQEEVIIYLVGPDGTGKGTITGTMILIFQDYAISIPVKMFTDAGWRAAEYHTAQLAGKRLAIAAELSKGSTWSEGFISEITGGDEFPARHPPGDRS